MPEYVRVKQTDTGHELSVLRSMYDFAPAAYEVIEDEKKPATDAGGNPQAPKYKTSVSAEATKKAAAPSKENN